MKCFGIYKYAQYWAFKRKPANYSEHVNTIHHGGPTQEMFNVFKNLTETTNNIFIKKKKHIVWKSHI